MRKYLFWFECTNPNYQVFKFIFLVKFNLIIIVLLTFFSSYEFSLSLFLQFVRRIGSKALQCSVFQYLLGLLKSEEFSRSTVSYKCLELVTHLQQCVP